MTDKIITGWLLLKDLPGIKAGTISSMLNDSGAFWGHDMYWDSASLKSALDFFLPIYAGEEVCPACKGRGELDCRPGQYHHVTHTIECPTCNGSRKISKQPKKPKCKKCNGISETKCGNAILWTCPTCNGTGSQDWDWPPIAGQEVWLLDVGGIPMKVTVKNVITPEIVTFLMDGDKDRALIDCFPTRALAEEHAEWRKDRGL